MIFSGLIITFLSTQNKSRFTSVLIVLYFVIATLSIFLIFKMRYFRKYYQKNYRNWILKDIPEETKKKDLERANREHDKIDKIEEFLKWVTFMTIILTFIYLFNWCFRDF